MKKTILAALLMMVGMTISAQPKEKVENVFEPHWYIQAQGGAQYTLGEIDFSDLISPNVQLSIGYQFDKVVGARLSANAWQSKAGSNIYGKEFKWKWNYVAPGIDFTFNLSNLFAGYNPNRVVSVSAFLGAGANIAWKNDEAKDASAAMVAAFPGDFNNKFYGQNLEYLWDGTKTRFFGRGGVNVDFRISDAVSLGIEANANCVSDRYNSKRANNADWYFNALAGLKINLGKTHSTKTVPAHCCPEPKVVEKIVEKIVEKPVPAPAPAPAVQKVEPIRRDVFFTINSSKVSAAEANKIKEIAEYLQKNTNAKVTVTGVADKGTGNSTINEKLATQRANVVAEALKSQYNISADRIKVESNGDRVQPFAQNDKNRVTICVAE